MSDESGTLSKRPSSAQLLWNRHCSHTRFLQYDLAGKEMAIAMALSSALDALPSSIGPSLAVGVLILCLWSLRSYLRLCRVPGPSLAAISNLPRVSWVLSNRAHDIHIALHQRYGKLVRFGPNMVSVGDAAEIPNLYGFTGKYAKVRKTRRSEVRLEWRKLITDPRLVGLLQSPLVLRQGEAGPHNLRNTG